MQTPLRMVYDARSSDQSAATLLRDVDEFLNYIAIVKTPEMDGVRASIERSLESARKDLVNVAARRHQNMWRGIACSLSESTPLAIAAAVLLGLLSGMVLRNLTGTIDHRMR